mgnify:CR=1 FL=1
MAYREETSVGHRKEAGLEGCLEVHQGARLEGSQGSGMEKGMEASVGEGVGSRTQPPWMGLST